MLLDPGFNLTLRPMKYPHFYDMYRNAIKNTWTVEEVDFSTDLVDLSADQYDRAHRGIDVGGPLTFGIDAGWLEGGKSCGGTFSRAVVM